MIFNELRYVTVDLDPPDNRYSWWTRVHEYSAVWSAINKIPGFNGSKGYKVHNVGWGWEGDHVIFRNDLDDCFGKENVMHSDIYQYHKKFPFVYHDITRNYPACKGKFDIVLCVSILEHLEEDERIVAIENMYDQLKPFGTLIITFDCSAHEFRCWLEKHPAIKKELPEGKRLMIKKEGTPLTISNSKKDNARFKYWDIRVALLSITRDGNGSN